LGGWNNRSGPPKAKQRRGAVFGGSAYSVAQASGGLAESDVRARLHPTRPFQILSSQWY